ncbi:hypothetical protein GA0115255_115691, partial [Streptomyces sp. Ncost-T6T-2b]
QPGGPGGRTDGGTGCSGCLRGLCADRGRRARPAAGRPWPVPRHAVRGGPRRRRGVHRPGLGAHRPGGRAVLGGRARGRGRLRCSGRSGSAAAGPEAPLRDGLRRRGRRVGAPRSAAGRCLVPAGPDGRRGDGPAVAGRRRHRDRIRLLVQRDAAHRGGARHALLRADPGLRRPDRPRGRSRDVRPRAGGGKPPGRRRCGVRLRRPRTARDLRRAAGSPHTGRPLGGRPRAGSPARRLSGWCPG